MSTKKPREAEGPASIQQQDAEEIERRRRADIDDAFSMRHARLRTLRLHFGLTEQEMAARLGMSKRAYAAWETPERSTRGGSLFAIRLAEQFGVSIDWIVIGRLIWSAPRDDNVPLAPGGGPLPRPTRH